MYDADGNGVLDLEEFRALWTHLGGEERLAEATRLAATELHDQGEEGSAAAASGTKAGAVDLDDPMLARFMQYLLPQLTTLTTYHACRHV